MTGHQELGQRPGKIRCCLACKEQDPRWPLAEMPRGPVGGKRQAGRPASRPSLSLGQIANLHLQPTGPWLQLEPNPEDESTATAAKECGLQRRATQPGWPSPPGRLWPSPCGPPPPGASPPVTWRGWRGAAFSLMTHRRFPPLQTQGVGAAARLWLVPSLEGLPGGRAGFAQELWAPFMKAKRHVITRYELACDKLLKPGRGRHST